MITYQNATRFRHVMFLQRQEIIDLHRDEVTAYFVKRLPDLSLSISEGLTESVSSDADCLIAPAAAWIGKSIKQLPQLRWIHFMGSGTDEVLELLQSRSDLLISKSAGVNAPAIAEFAIGAMLYFSKNFDKFLEQQRECRWNRFWLSELSGRHLVILGAGAIAQSLAERATNLGLRITAVGTKRGRRPALDNVVTLDELPVILPSADFIVCCLPLTSTTRRLIGPAEFRAMPPQAIFVNVSRGGIVDENALMQALSNGWIYGAAVDVFEDEPLPKGSPLWKCPSLLITPHVAGTTNKYIARMLQSFERNLRSFSSTGRLATPVDLDRGY
jgi:phosphoglycerate dehydrogenase-like enzyme